MLLFDTNLTILDIHVNVVVCTDLSGPDSQVQVGVDNVVTAGSLGGVMVSNLCTIFPMTLVAVTMILHAVWLLNLPCRLCKATTDNI